MTTDRGTRILYVKAKRGRKLFYFILQNNSVIIAIKVSVGFYLKSG